MMWNFSKNEYTSEIEEEYANWIGFNPSYDNSLFRTYRGMVNSWLPEDRNDVPEHSRQYYIERLTNVMMADFNEAWLQAIEKVPRDMASFVQRPTINFAMHAKAIVRTVSQPRKQLLSDRMRENLVIDSWSKDENTDKTE